MVIFDGLGELLDTSRRADVTTRVERFCAEYPQAPVLVTSRAVGYDQARLEDRQFTCYHLEGFKDEQVTDYARKWFAQDPEAGADEADAFLAESESVPDLRSNPLLLSLICILYRGEGPLPRDRAGVYAKCADLLLHKWDERRRIRRDLRTDHLVEPTCAIWPGGCSPAMRPRRPLWNVNLLSKLQRSCTAAVSSLRMTPWSPPASLSSSLEAGCGSSATLVLPQLERSSTHLPIEHSSNTSRRRTLLTTASRQSGWRGH